MGAANPTPSMGVKSAIAIKPLPKPVKPNVKNAKNMLAMSA